MQGTIRSHPRVALTSMKSWASKRERAAFGPSGRRGMVRCRCLHESCSESEGVSKIYQVANLRRGNVDGRKARSPGCPRRAGR